MLEVIILALALSMDALAVSIGLGSKHVLNAKSLSLSAAIYFGVFQGIMPLIGYLGGQGLFGLIGSFAHWIAFIYYSLSALKWFLRQCLKELKKVSPKSHPGSC